MKYFSRIYEIFNSLKWFIQNNGFDNAIFIKFLLDILIYFFLQLHFQLINFFQVKKEHFIENPHKNDQIIKNNLF